MGAAMSDPVDGPLEAQPAEPAAALDALSWLDPATRVPPALALQHIKTLCGLYPDLFSAMFVVSATHMAVSREMLAMALKQFRPDAAALSQEDVQSLLVSIVNGANQAFEAVLRTRKDQERKGGGAALPWGRDTD